MDVFGLILMSVTILHLSERSEVNHEHFLLSVYPVSAPRFEPATFTERSKHWTVAFRIHVFIPVLYVYVRFLQQD